MWIPSQEKWKLIVHQRRLDCEKGRDEKLNPILVFTSILHGRLGKEKLSIVFFNLGPIWGGKTIQFQNTEKATIMSLLIDKKRKKKFQFSLMNTQKKSIKIFLHPLTLAFSILQGFSYFPFPSLTSFTCILSVIESPSWSSSNGSSSSNTSLLTAVNANDDDDDHNHDDSNYHQKTIEFQKGEKERGNGYINFNGEWWYLVQFLLLTPITFFLYMRYPFNFLILKRNKESNLSTLIPNQTINNFKRNKRWNVGTQHSITLLHIYKVMCTYP